MNDMATSVLAAQETAGDPTSFTMDDAHILRSKMLGKCAAVECWLVDRIQPYQTPAPNFSKKVKQLEEIMETHKEAFHKPTRIQSYLKEFLPFAVFRSELAHSKLNLIETTDGIFLIKIQNASCGSNERSAKSIVLPSQELKIIWDEMCTAAQKITNYTITPPSPSPPKQAS
ncbi:hypothetical protein [Sphingorhabdus sp. M41]|uniref:hypothetical protein n=1 Tax=Sphingorhabdus sp. M41 TaxID=1806885 RepID=UPI00078DB0A5|nr:hypothetical protein [Sphingorhabdus sp. M41]AMO72199.1 hypothetical protein AZE99_10355 [Sphingorhabdus sp. M41]